MAVRFTRTSSQYWSRTSGAVIDYNADYTLMAWVYLTSDVNGYYSFFGTWGNVDSSVDCLQTTNDGTTLNLYCANVDVGSVIDANGSTLPIGQWVHVALSHERKAVTDSVVRAYLNGAQDISGSQNLTSRRVSTNMRVGSWYGASDYANGRVAQIRAFQHVLTPDQIRTEMESAYPVLKHALWGWWPAWERGAGLRNLDLSGNGYDWTETATPTDEDDPPLNFSINLLPITPASIATNATVTAVVAAATADAIAPSVSTGSSATVTAVIAAATAEAIAPAVSTSSTVTGVVAAATAEALAPAVSTSGNVTVTAVIAAATASVLAPTIGTNTQNHKVDVGNGYTDVTPRQLVRTSGNRLYVSGWKFDTFPHGGIGSSPWNTQTLRMYKANQAGVPTSFTRLDSANEPAGVVSWSMAIDCEDVIHVVWTTRATWGSPADTGVDNYVKYCQFDTATDVWGTVENIETTAGTKEIGQGDELVSIAIDAGGVPHIAYVKDDGTRRRVIYRNRAGGSWSSATTVDDQTFGAGEGCWHPGIVFDNAGRIVVTWLRGDNMYSSWTATTGRLFVRVYSSGVWGTTHDVVGAAVWTGIDQGSPLYVDANGRYHVCYINTSKQVQYRYSDDQGATWTANSPSSGTYTADNPAPGPGASGKVRIYSHGSGTPPNLVYWEGDGGAASWGSPSSYITDTGFDCSTNARWTQYWWWYPNTLDIAYWKADYPTNELYIGSEIQGTDTAVKAALAAATAAGIAPSVSVTSNVTVTGVVAAATAAGIAPAVSVTSNVTVTGVVAAATAEAVAPSVGTSVVVTGVIAAATAAGIAPSVSVTSNVTVTGVVAAATAEAIAPMITTTGIVNISGVVASATADAIAPSISTGSAVTGVIAAATAEGIAPSVGTGITVTGVIAAATAEAVAPTVSVTSNVTVTGVVAAATAEGIAPSISTTGIVNISGVVASATAEAIAPSISTGITVTGVIAAATAEFNAPEIYRDYAIVAVTATASAVMLAPEIYVVPIPRDVLQVTATIDRARSMTATIDRARSIEVEF